MKEALKRKSDTQSAVVVQRAQERFLTQMVQERGTVDVFLISGVKLEGEIVAFDEYVIFLKGALADMVYKHAVSTIQPVTSDRQKRKATSEHGTSRAPTIRRAKTRLPISRSDGNGGSALKMAAAMRKARSGR